MCWRCQAAFRSTTPVPAHPFPHSLSLSPCHTQLVCCFTSVLWHFVGFGLHRSLEVDDRDMEVKLTLANWRTQGGDSRLRRKRTLESELALVTIKADTCCMFSALPTKCRPHNQVSGQLVTFKIGKMAKWLNKHMLL